MCCLRLYAAHFFCFISNYIYIAFSLNKVYTYTLIKQNLKLCHFAIWRNYGKHCTKNA